MALNIVDINVSHSTFTNACFIFVTFLTFLTFLRATAVPAGTAEACISYGDSVCPSVTTRCRTKPTLDRDFGSSPHDSLECLVSNEVILMSLGDEIPLERGH